MKQRYRVIERIDAGGMAEVFRGRSLIAEGIEKEVAIKRILPALTKKQKFLDMFLDEARLVMRLNHANITQVFDVGRSAGTYFIVMEYVDGANLRRLFQRASERGYRIPLKVACYILNEVCKGLACAHEMRGEDGQPLRIVHRDVSPPNILVSRAGEVKLVDFGLAKAVTQVALTDPGVVKGKFSYLSPEAAEGRTVDHRADIFAAGIVLFELLTNRQLFRGRTDVETLELVRCAEIPLVSKLNPDIPESFERIIQKALARDPAKRYNSAREMGDVISAFLFENNLKVTAYDLQDVFRLLVDTHDGAEAEDSRQRIEDLIEEEILNLSMIGHLTELNAEGSRPIHVDGLHIDIPGRHDFSDVWDGRGGHLEIVSEVDADLSGGLDLSFEEGLSERLEGTERSGPHPSVEDQRRAGGSAAGRTSLVVTLIVAGLLVVGAITALIIFLN